MVKFVLPLLVLICSQGFAQGSFAPQAGELGSTAIPKDSACFRDWAISCTLERGLRQAGMPDSGYASAGAAVYANGPADAPLTVSLGDSGIATLLFTAPFYDGEGADFAVFENGFGSGPDAFLEFAFVEVSSDGEHFFRFPAISEISTATQKAAFENTDASMVHNLAGKYIANYGVPFDLAELPDTALLDKQRVTHVRIVDVIGSIDAEIATYDSQGGLINDPWPTNFGPGGFDLDAVGIINSSIPIGVRVMSSKQGPVLFNIDLLGRASQGATTLQYNSEGEKYLTIP